MPIVPASIMEVFMENINFAVLKKAKEDFEKLSEEAKKSASLTEIYKRLLTEKALKDAKYRLYLSADLPFPVKGISTSILETVFDALPRPKEELLKYYAPFGGSLWEKYRDLEREERVCMRLAKRKEIYGDNPIKEDGIKASELPDILWRPGDSEIRTVFKDAGY